MLLLTGCLKLLNVLRITELTANQLINYGFFQVSLNFRPVLESDRSSILSGMFSDFNNNGKWFYIIFCHIFCFSSPKTTPIYHLKAHLNQKSSSSWRTLLKFHKWTSKIAFKAQHSALLWFLYIIFLSTVSTPRPWGIVC